MFFLAQQTRAFAFMPETLFPVDLSSIASAAFVAFGAIVLAVAAVLLGIRAVKWVLRYANSR